MPTIQDRLPRLLAALSQARPEAYAQLLALPFHPIPSHAAEDRDAEWWGEQAEANECEILEALGADFASFFDSYLETALWSTTSLEGDRPLGDAYGPEDIDDKSRAELESYARDFYLAHCHLWLAAGIPCSQAGHDLWLTAAGHGAGYWDGDYPEPAGRHLAKASRPYSADLHEYRSADGSVKLHC